MKRQILTISIVFCSIVAHSEVNKEFLATLARVESGNNPKAVGDSGKAIGIYQIHESYFADAKSFNPNLRKYAYNSCFNPKISELVVKTYLARYCPGGSMEDMARAHNGGCNWKKNKSKTNNYWNKFRRMMRK